MWDEPAATKTLLFPSGLPSDRPSAPADRPSERPTRPTLPPPDDPSDSEIELSVRDFFTETDEEADDEADEANAKASTLKPPPEPSPPRDRSRLLFALRVAAAGLLLLVAVVLLLAPPNDPPRTRDPRIAFPDRLSITEAAAPPAPRPEQGSCIVTAPPRFVAPRAQIHPGIDVSSTATGFIVTLASASNEATAVRLEGTSLRAAETVRVRPSSPSDIRRVFTPDLDVPSFRIELVGTHLVARTHDRLYVLWPLPLPPKDARVDALRVASRDDGGAVVVTKRGSTLHVGMMNGALAAIAPLQTFTRANATLGTPSVIANGGGAAIAWAERARGASEWTVMVASLGGGEIEAKPVAAGMSPSLGVFPDGTFAVAYADGEAGAHRIVVRRLGPDLAPIGDPIVGSPDGTNAGQPVMQIRPDGRALVAWLAAARGQPPSVYATPLECDVSTSM